VQKKFQVQTDSNAPDGAYSNFLPSTFANSHHTQRLPQHSDFVVFKAAREAIASHAAAFSAELAVTNCSRKCQDQDAHTFSQTFLVAVVTKFTEKKNIFGLTLYSDEYTLTAS